MNALLPLLFCLAVPLVFAAAKYLKDLEVRLAGWLFGSMATGSVAGMLFVIVSRQTRDSLRIPLMVLLVSAGAVWLFRREHAPDVFEGLLRGGLLAAGFGIPLVIEFDRPFAPMAIALVASLAAAVVASSMSDAVSRAGTMAFVLAAGAMAAAAASPAADIVDPAVLAWVVALGAALAAAASPFLLFPGVAEELEQESQLGVLPRGILPQLSHPLRRLSRGSLEPETHRRIIRLAWTLALRRRRHRSTGREESRLHQVEIFKLRQELSLLLRANDEMSGSADPDGARIQSWSKGSPTE